MKLTNAEYAKLVEAQSPKSPTGKDVLWAFFIGGLVCTLGQVFIEVYKYLGLENDLASTLASVTLILIAAVLTGLGVYDNIAKKAGAGTLVPITGFSNAVVSPALEFKSEGMITGTAAKMFIISGPVIVYGVSASVVYGIVYALLL